MKQKFKITFRDQKLQFVLAKHASETYERFLFRAFLLAVLNEDNAQIASELCRTDSADIESNHFLIFLRRTNDKYHKIAQKISKLCLIFPRNSYKMPIELMQDLKPTQDWVIMLKGKEFFINESKVELYAHQDHLQNCPNS